MSVCMRVCTRVYVIGVLCVRIYGFVYNTVSASSNSIFMYILLLFIIHLLFIYHSVILSEGVCIESLYYTFIILFVSALLFILVFYLKSSGLIVW